MHYLKQSKNFYKIFYFFLLLNFINCATKIPLKSNFYNTKKVGIIIKLNQISVAKKGGQGVVDMALTPGNRFMKPLKEIEPKLNFNLKLNKEIIDFLTKNKKECIFIEKTLDKKKLNDFDKPNSDKKYSKKDYRGLKKEFNVDELMILDPNHGLLVSYYGFIELDKEAYTKIDSEIIDLEDNSIIFKDNIFDYSRIEGNWKEGESYGNLLNSIKESNEFALDKFKSLLN